MKHFLEAANYLTKSMFSDSLIYICIVLRLLLIFLMHFPKIKSYNIIFSQNFDTVKNFSHFNCTEIVFSQSISLSDLIVNAIIIIFNCLHS